MLQVCAAQRLPDQVDLVAEAGVLPSALSPDIRDRAALVLARMGLTVSDAVRILLTRTAQEGAQARPESL